MGSGQPRELVRAGGWKEAGQLLQQARERHGWSHAEAAEHRAGVSLLWGVRSRATAAPAEGASADPVQQDALSTFVRQWSRPDE